MKKVPNIFIKTTPLCGENDRGLILSDAMLQKALEESRWQPGIITFQDDSKGEGMRRRQLSGWDYEFLNQVLKPSEIKTFLASEWIHWRDDR